MSIRVNTRSGNIRTSDEYDEDSENLIKNKSLSKTQSWHTYIIYINYVAIAAHVAFATYIFVQKQDWKAPFAVEWKDWVPANSTLKCFDTTINGTKNMCTMVDRTETLFNASIKLESGLFHLLSAIFETIAIMWDRKKYIEDAAIGKNALRWIEYSISASLMILIIAQVNGITSAWTQILLFAGTATIMIIGLVGENERVNNNTSGKNQKWTIHLMGWGLHLAIWSVIIWNFQLTMTRQTSEVTKPPKAVQWMIYVIFVFFTSFGFVQLAQTAGRFKDRQYIAEIVYVSLSLTSKTVMGFLLFSGGVMRDGHVEYFDS